MDNKEEKPKAKYAYEWGWNDPPSMNFGDHVNVTGKKPPPSLQQRVFYPTNDSSTNQPTQPQGPSFDSKMAPPTNNYLGSTPKTSGDNDLNKKSDEHTEVPESPELSVIMSSLERTLSKYSENIQSRVVEEIQKKLLIFSKQWNDNKLSDSVRHKMHSLGKAMSESDYSKAHELHVSLMVDHAGEVSQWMVGIKKIISSAQQNS